MDRDRSVRIASLLASALVGLLWAANYPLRFLDAAAVVLAHLMVGAGIALVLPPLARRLALRAPGGAAVLIGVLLLFAVPVLLSELSLAALPRSLRVAAVLVAGGGLLLLGLGAGRAGRVACALTGAAMLALLLPLTGDHADRLPSRPTVEVRRSDPAAERLVVIGIDGADWSVIDPLLEKGELPNLARLAETGVAGILESTEPTFSPVVWSSIFSGKTPEKHGITEWRVAHAANRRAAMLWEMVAGAGLTSVVVNVPGTWPPGRIRGALVSGFPIPGVVRKLPGIEGSQYLGTVVAPTDRDGLVPTVLADRDGEGRLRAEVAIGEALPEPRSRFRHYAIDVLLRHRLLSTVTRRVSVRIDPSDGKTPKRMKIDGRDLELAEGAWSGWLATDISGVGTVFKVRRIGDDTLYLTPPFQDPEAPLFPFTSSPELGRVISEREMYVVEGAGWKGAVDSDLDNALFEHLVQVEEQHVDGTRAAASMISDWSLLIYVFTVTDRVSHGFWHVHEPESRGGARGENAEPGPRVRDAYRFVDRRMGRLLGEIGEGATVVLLSDHGFQADPSAGYGGHRIEGIFVASGPGIRPTDERITLSILDVTPTLLALLGFPVATDMDGKVAEQVLGNDRQSGFIPTYERESDPAHSSETSIDETTEEQLRSLGYLD